MVTALPTDAAGETLPRDLLDLVVELAICVHKRTIYPATHPMLRDAVAQCHAGLARFLDTRPALSIGVANKRLVVEGTATLDDHIHLRELAATLHEHMLGAVRILEGVTPDELTGFLAAISRSTLRDAEPFGHESRETLAQWPHLELYPVAFDRLTLLAEGEEGDSTSRAGLLWIALARAALAGGWSEEAAGDPRHVARKFEERRDDRAYDQVVVGCLVQLLDELKVSGVSAPAAVRHRASDLIENLSDEGLARLVSLGEAPAQRRELVMNALESLSARAVVDLVSTSAKTGASGAASSSLLRLLNKLARNAAAPTFGREADAMLRLSVRRLMQDWTLENPNPEHYDRWLTASAAAAIREAGDEQRDRTEPARMVDLGLETGVLGPSVDAAFGRLIMQRGPSAAVAHLDAWPSSVLRDALMDRVLSEDALREQLTLEKPDWALVGETIGWLQSRAVPVLLASIDRRPDGDADDLLALLVQVGRAGLEEIGSTFANLSAATQRRVIPVFDAIGDWPGNLDPAELMRHPDAGVRREALRSLIKAGKPLDDLLPLALRDRDLRVFNLALQASMRAANPATARALMSRLADPSLTSELRVRMIRAVAQTRAPEALPWLIRIAATTRWFLGSAKLLSTPEALAALNGIATHFGHAAESAHLVSLGRASRSVEVRRAAGARINDGGEA
jgi:hypothetical protein